MQHARQGSRLDYAAMAPLVFVAALLLVIYAPIVWGMAKNWWVDPNYSHGFLVPAVSAWLVWRQRGQLARLEPSPNPWGLLAVAAGLTPLLVGWWAHEFFLQRISIIPVGWGLVLLTRGWPTARRLLFAFLYLTLMVPLPYMLYDAAAFPLRLLAAELAGWTFRLLGVPVLVEGNIIHLPSNVLNVVDACSGIRSLISLLAAGAVMAYVILPRRWPKVVVVLLTPLAAVAANSLRVVAAGLLAERFGPSMLEGATHDLTGWLVFMAAFFAVLGITWLLGSFWRKAKDPDAG